MRREIIFLLLVSTLVSAALDQSYVQTVSWDGSSEITKSTDISVFQAELNENGVEKVRAYCEEEPACSVEGNVITITEEFQPGNYYTFTAESGFPFTTYTFQQNKIPTDVFSESLDNVLKAAGAINKTGKAADVLDLTDREKNVQSAVFFRKFKANITYVINMPGGISEAHAGDVNAEVEGSSATFDVVALMEESEPVTVKSGELNLGLLVLVAGVIVVGALAISFVRSKAKSKSKRRKK